MAVAECRAGQAKATWLLPLEIGNNDSCQCHCKLPQALCINTCHHKHCTLVLGQLLGHALALAIASKFPQLLQLPRTVFSATDGQHSLCDITNK